MFKPKQDYSNTWRGILENVKFVKRRPQAEVGNGKRTLLWFHQAMAEPFCNFAMSPIPSDVEDATVAELWDNNKRWQQDKFEMLLLEDVIKLIASFELYPSIHDAD